MTTFQDPPPQSRRAVRQSERGESAPETAPNAAAASTDAAAEGSQVAGIQQAPESASAAVHTDPAQYIFDPSAGHAHVADTPASDQDAPPAGGAHAGRRQARAAAPADADNTRPLGDLPAPGDSGDQSAYRVRDFSPEGGRRAAPAAPTASFAPPARPVELDYQTQGVMPAPGPAHNASVPMEDTLNHTLSRRELREMRAAAEALNPPQLVAPADKLPEAIDTLLNSGPIDIPTLAPPPGQSQALAEAMAEFDMLTKSRREAEARARDAQVASLATPIVPQPRPLELPSAPEPVQQAPDLVVPDAVVPDAAVPAAVPQPYPTSVPQPIQASAPQPFPTSSPFPASAPTAYPPTATIPSPPVPDANVASAPVASAPVVDVPVASAPEVASVPDVLMPPTFQAQSVPQASVPQPPLTQTQPSVPLPGLQQQSPAQPDDQHGGRSPRASGHWRVQAAIEDDELPYENTLSRTVGSNTSAITTSALVLPSVPQPGGGILNAMTATGEILVTGTIDLPKSLGSTGAHPSRVDNSDFEDDPLDSQIAAPDSAPVRAIRAISTNTSTRGVIETKRPQGTRMLTAVIAIASVLCVGLVGLLVYAFASGKL